MEKAEIFEQVLSRIDWIKEIIRKRGWDLTQDLILEGPASEDEIRSVEEELGVEIPGGYKDLFMFSKHLEFRYEYDEETPPEFRGNYSGEIGWNLGLLKERHENFMEWVEVSSDLDYNEAETVEEAKQLWAGKIPLLEVASGDIIVVGSSPSEVVYFSCLQYALHGRKLAQSLWEFLEFHSRVGFAGGEDWQLEPFFDTGSESLRVKGERVDKFVEWLNKCEPVIKS